MCDLQKTIFLRIRLEKTHRMDDRMRKELYLRCLFIWQVFTFTKWDICKESAKKDRIERVREIGSFGLNNHGEARVDRV